MAKQVSGGPQEIRDGATAHPAVVDFDDFLARLGDKDRNNLQKHLAVCEAEAGEAHAALWKRLVCSLASLAPFSVRTTGQRAIQFFVADGRYRLQVFALEDPRDGTLVLYAADALDAAVRAGVLRGPRGEHLPAGLGNADSVGGPAAAAVFYEVRDEPGVLLQVEVLSAAGTSTAPDYYKHMLGWNRRAIKVTVPVSAAESQLAALEVLCQHAARQTGLGAAPAVSGRHPGGQALVTAGTNAAKSPGGRPSAGGFGDRGGKGSI